MVHVDTPVSLLPHTLTPSHTHTLTHSHTHSEELLLFHQLFLRGLHYRIEKWPVVVLGKSTVRCVGVCIHCLKLCPLQAIRCHSCCEQTSVVHVCSRFIMSTVCVCYVNNCSCFSLTLLFMYHFCFLFMWHTPYAVCVLQHCDSHVTVLCSAHCGNLTADNLLWLIANTVGPV